MEASWAVFQHSDPEGEANLGGGPHEIQPSPDLSMARTGTDTSLEIEGVVVLVVVLGVRWRRDERVVCNNNSNSNNNNPAFLAGVAAVVGEEGGLAGPLLQQERILMHS